MRRHVDGGSGGHPSLHPKWMNLMPAERPPTEGDEMAKSSEDAEAMERESRAVRRLLHSFRSTDSYGLVLLMIVGTYVLATTMTEQWGATIVLVAQIGTVWVALRTSRAHRGYRGVATVLFAVAIAAAVANLFADRDSGLAAFVFLTGSALYIVAPVSIVRHLAYRREVDQETMLGALGAYLLIGMAFAFAYRFLGAAQTDPFFGAAGEGTLSQDLFFSFITLTTTGYGNLVPAGNPGQSLAVLEALVGQLFLVTAVGKVVSAWRPRGWQAREDVGVSSSE
jgi:Ion channel